MNVECSREQDVLDAVSAGRWPDRVDRELHDHVNGCGVCVDVAEIAAPLFQEQEAAWNEPDVPPSSVVWWRAQIRAREEAGRAATRPIAVAQGIAVAALAFTALLFVPITLRWLSEAATAVSEIVLWLMPRAIDVSRAFSLATGSVTPLVALAAWAILAPILLYVALVEE